MHPVSVLLVITACLLQQGIAFRPNVDVELVARAETVSALLTKGPVSSVPIPSKMQFSDVVKPLIASIDQAKVRNWVTGMTSFPERYYTSQNGLKAAQWIMDQVAALPVVNGAKLSVNLFQHSWKVQPSVIARYEAATPSLLEGIIITGSHLDTLGKGSGKPEPNFQPGADDCASGSVAVFEALRVMTSSGFIPGRPIEFHWYAGEELGILGSNEVAESYAKSGIKVVSYLNLDQSGYTKPGKTPVMGVLMDYTTKASTAFMKSVISTYSTLGFVETRCGYKCTDNSAWYDHGYEVGFAAEAAFSDCKFNGLYQLIGLITDFIPLAYPYSDTVNADGSARDVIANLNFTHIQEFAKTTIGYTVELSLAGKGVSPPSSTLTTSAVTTTTKTTAPAITPATITVGPSISVVVFTKTPTVVTTPAPVISGTSTVTVTVPPTYAVSVITSAAFNGARIARRADTTTVSVTVGPSVSLSVATVSPVALARRGGAATTTGVPTVTTTTAATTTTTTTMAAKTPVAFTVAPTLKLAVVYL
ncbi:Leucine aminopeptidase 1 [Dinochytrium kinnereticum]|nr:Leucine aminopeptidase 1 [Dinochytrium kinnereticum]